MANDISTRLVLENREYQRRLLESRSAMWEYARTANQATTNAANSFRRMVAEVRTAQTTFGKVNSAVKVNQGLISNSIFAVEDAASVWGTSGFAGAVRAASNNLTMMAAAFGPWAMAATVAVTTITQLYLAFTKTNKEMDKTEERIRTTKELMEGMNATISDGIKFHQEYRRASMQDLGKMVNARRDELEIIDAQLKQQQGMLKLQRTMLLEDKQRANEAMKNPRGGRNREYARNELAKQQEKVAQAEGVVNELLERRKRLEFEIQVSQQRAVRLRNIQIETQVGVRNALKEQMQYQDGVNQRAKQRNSIIQEHQRQTAYQAQSQRFADALDAYNAKKKEESIKRQKQAMTETQKAQQDGATGGTRGSLEAAKAIQSFRAGNGTLNQEKLLQQAVNELRKANRKKQREVTIGVGMPGFN